MTCWSIISVCFSGMLVGIIEIVPNAKTVAKIQKEFGGFFRGTFKDEVLKKWLERNNPAADKMEEAVESFMLSCAGYCVATYILGECNSLPVIFVKRTSAREKSSKKDGLCEQLHWSLQMFVIKSFYWI